jgi:hypothetical protein
MIIATINARPKIIRNKSRKVYLYKKGNLDAVKEYLDRKLKSFKEKYKETNIEGYWTTFKSHLINAMNQYIPSLQSKSHLLFSRTASVTGELQSQVPVT